MSEPAPRYPEWKAPAEDGRVLIWPEPARLLADAIENHKRLSRAGSIKLQNISLAEVRAKTRAWIGHHDENAPLIGTGHQTELYHPGVWAKLALVNQAAAKLNGAAFHFAVDTDSPKHLNLRWPGKSIPITDDPAIASAAWSGLLAAPTPAHTERILENLQHDAAGFGYEPVAVDVLRSLRRLALESSDLPRALTNAMHELDWSLELRHHVMIVSPILFAAGYLLFAHHALARAAEFAASYNRALAEFRRIHRTRTPTRPMPDLFVSEDSIETPFWLDDLSSGARSRPSVFRRDGAYVLKLLSGEEFVFDNSGDGWESAERLKQFLLRTQHRLSPRALTLTMFLRLIVADQFIHGIGGGRYDQVADSIIADHFQIEPPKFAVTTATIYLPQALGRTRACISCVLQEGHKLKHRALGEKKMRLVTQIAALPRHSSERATVFSEMHQRRKLALAQDPAVARWERRLMETQQRDAEDETLFDRELFYALQPRERLVQLIAQYARSLM